MSSSNATFTPLNLKECMETIRAKVAEMMVSKRKTFAEDEEELTVEGARYGTYG